MLYSIGVIVIVILAFVGFILGMCEPPRIDYSETWEMIIKELKN